MPGASPADPGEDLLGRWMAHHAGEAPSSGPTALEAQGDQAPVRAGAPADASPGSPPAEEGWWGDARPAAPAASTGVHTDTDTAGTPEEPAPAEPTPPTRPPRRRRTTEPTPVPSTVTFPPRRGPRRVLGLALLLMLTATGVAGWSAYQEPDVESLTLLGTLATLTLVTWAVRAGSALTTLEVVGGQLHVHQGGRRTTFDLTSAYTPVEVVGRPGRRGWKVVLGRGTARRPFVVDGGLVDPVRFTEVLRRYRPE